MSLRSTKSSMTTVAEVENADADNDNLENFKITEFHSFGFVKKVNLIKYFLIGILQSTRGSVV